MSGAGLGFRLHPVGAGLIGASVDGLEDGRLKPKPQPARAASRAPKLSREHGRLDWSWPTERLRNRVRGANPQPGAFTESVGGVLKVHRAAAASGDLRGNPGTVLCADPKQGLVVATGDGALELTQVQPEGKQRMEAAAFVLGHAIEVGTALGASDY